MTAGATVASREGIYEGTEEKMKEKPWCRTQTDPTHPSASKENHHLPPGWSGNGQLSGPSRPSRAFTSSIHRVPLTFPVSSWFGRGWRGWPGERGAGGGRKRGSRRWRGSGSGHGVIVSVRVSPAARADGSSLPVSGLWQELQVVIQADPPPAEPQQWKALPLQPLSQGLQGLLCSALSPTVPTLKLY